MLGKLKNAYLTQYNSYLALSFRFSRKNNITFRYTSLGDKTNTVPNPHLKRVNNQTGEISYRPAFELDDADALERLGRLKKKKSEQ